MMGCVSTHISSSNTYAYVLCAVKQYTTALFLYLYPWTELWLQPTVMESIEPHDYSTLGYSPSNILFWFGRWLLFM